LIEKPSFVFIYIYCLDSAENRTEIIHKPFVYHGRYHRRVRRQSDNLDTASAVLSILPLDSIGSIIGQLMATGLKEMLNPNVGQKIVKVLETQGPNILTSLFTNLYSTLSVPVRSSSTKTNLTISSVSMNNNSIKQLSNTTTSEIMNAIRGSNPK